MQNKNKMNFGTNERTNITTEQTCDLPLSLCLAPCPPVSSSVTVSMICDNATALFSWAWSGGAASYELSAISNNGYIATCISQENYCNISQLACGQTYKVRLTAINDGCRVTEETGVTFQTRELTF